jgi:anthranilate/para-aminobenzoate synthase component I
VVALLETPFVPKKAKAFRQLFSRLQIDSHYAILLESAGGPESLNRQSLLAVQPTETLTLSKGNLLYQRLAYGPQDKTGQVVEETETTCDNWQALQLALEKYGLNNLFSSASKEHQWETTWFGVLGYEFYLYCFDKEVEDDHRERTIENSAFPDFCLVRFAQGVVLDVQPEQGDRTPLQTWGFENQVENELTHLWETLCASDLAPLENETRNAFNPEFVCSFSQDSFEEQVSEVKKRIACGDIYQANLTMRFSTQVQMAPLYVYEALSQKNPSPFCGIFKTPQHVLLCNSPERLILQDETGKLQTRPIAGTRGRGKTQTEDEALGQTLLKDEKERAEHLMLVDLLRNDLGRVSQPGSVEVDELLTLERYSHVTHLVSNVVGQKKESISPWEVIRSLFPGGTITGCPKMRCIEILNALEPVNRGWYTGSLGYINFQTGRMDWNILIRSLFLNYLENNGNSPKSSDLNQADINFSSLYNVDIHVGAGIVADSVPEFEYKECLRKAQASFSALSKSLIPNP